MCHESNILKIHPNGMAMFKKMPRVGFEQLILEVANRNEDPNIMPLPLPFESSLQCFLMVGRRFGKFNPTTHCLTMNQS